MIPSRLVRERRLKLCDQLQVSPPAFGPIGEDIINRSYARKKKNGKTESWAEACYRVTHGNCDFVDDKYIDEGEREALLQAMYSMAIIPAGRHIRNTGIRDRQFVHNCHTTGWVKEDPFEHFGFTMKALMQGGGVGSNYSEEHIKHMPLLRNIPKVSFICSPNHKDWKDFGSIETMDFRIGLDQYCKNNEETYYSMVDTALGLGDMRLMLNDKVEGQIVNSSSGDIMGQLVKEQVKSSISKDKYAYVLVEDNRQGWVDAAEMVFNAAWGISEYSKKEIVFDLSEIREYGAPLESFGGTASGPVVLVQMINDFLRIFEKSLKKSDAEPVELGPIEYMELDHAIAVCVCAGGSRRSARMSMLHWKDPHIWDFIDCKYTSDKNQKPHWTTNISVIIDDEFIERYKNKDPYVTNFHLEICKRMLTRGEPGYWNISNASRDEIEQLFATNPCISGEMRVPTTEGMRLMRDLAEEYRNNPMNEKLGVFTDPRFGTGFASRNVCNIHKTKEDYIRTIETVDGYRIECTDEHKIMTPHGYKQAADLETGDEIHIWSGGGAFGGKFTYLQGLLVGWLFGDGWFDSDGSPVLGFYGNDDGCMENILTVAKDQGFNLCPRYYEDRSAHYLQDAAISELVRSCGVTKDGGKQVTELMWQSSREFQMGFLNALFSADGTVNDNTEKGAYIRLAQSDEQLLRDVQLMLLNFGIKSKLLLNRRKAGHRMMPDGNGGKKLYPNRAQHELSVSSSMISLFDSEIGLIHGEKQTKISQVNDNVSFYSTKWSSKIKSVNLGREKVPVFDLTQPTTGSFIANGIVISNCGEQGLNEFDACDLGHFNALMLYLFPESEESILRLITRFLIRATYADMTSDYQKETVRRNRRIGVGFLGFADYVAMNGVKYSECWKDDKIKSDLQRWYSIVKDEAERYSFELRIPVPVKVTTVAPTGSISFIPGVTPGCQPIKFDYFHRRVRYSKSNPMVKEKIAAGHFVEDDLYAKNTSVVSYWMKDSLLDRAEKAGLDASIVECDSQVGLRNMLEVQAMVQENWADNSVSFTATLPTELVLNELGEPIKDEDPDDMSTKGRLKTRNVLSPEELADILGDFLPRIKGTTIITEGSYLQMPYERCTKEKYLEMTRGKVAEVGNAEQQCANGVCDI